MMTGGRWAASLVYVGSIIATLAVGAFWGGHVVVVVGGCCGGGSGRRAWPRGRRRSPAGRQRATSLSRPLKAPPSVPPLTHPPAPQIAFTVKGFVGGILCIVFIIVQFLAMVW
jgi:hypothetical protein